MSHPGNIDIADLKQAADGRWVEILTQFGIAPDILDGRHHPCPKCGGADRFRCVEPAVGACYCNQCFKNRNGDGIAAIAWFNDWTFPKTVQALGQHLGMNGRNRQSVDPADIVKAIALCKRVPLESFKSFGAYSDQRGKLLVCRVPMFDEHRAECGYQDFSKISPKFLKGMCADGQPVGLFVVQWPTPGDEVLITEGVKDSAALHSLGYRAVGIPGSQLQVKHARVFAGCHVKVVPDLDATGMKAAHVTAARLMGVAASVQIVRMPGEIKAKDGDGVREVLARADGEILLRQSIADAVEWHAAENEPSTKPDDSEWTSINSDQGRTDRANARRFCETHCDTARFCHA